MTRLSDSTEAITLHECNYKVHMYSIDRDRPETNTDTDKWVQYAMGSESVLVMGLYLCLLISMLKVRVSQYDNENGFNIYYNTKLK